MRLFLAILLGKSIAYFTRLFKIGGGSAAPGLYALSLEPDLVQKLASKIPINVVITGTNGKTTTAKMLAHFAKMSGLNVIRNHTGSNLERGIASALIHGVSLSHPWGGLNRHLGIWELDEAAFNNVAPKLKPDVIVFLNVFRDQLDRYGEVDSVIKQWSRTLTSLTSQTIVLVNGDDSNTAKLAKSFIGKTYVFGVKDYKIVGESLEHKKENENLDFEAKNVKLRGLASSSFLLSFHHQSSTVHLPLPGIYHIYDFLASFAAGLKLGLKPKQIIASLKDYSPAFGRVEKLDFGYIFLIKNPAGATQVFQTLAPNIKSGDVLLLALNDNLADGKDVSWIWDADFNKLKVQNVKFKIYVSGTRASDLAVRLKYAGIDLDNIKVEPDLEKAFRQTRKGLKDTLFILPTYTAMLELQSILTKTGIKKHYWEEV